MAGAGRSPGAGKRGVIAPRCRPGQRAASLPTLALSGGVRSAPRLLVELNTRLDRRLAARKLAFMPFRIMEEPADLKSVKR